MQKHILDQAYYYTCQRQSIELLRKDIEFWHVQQPMWKNRINLCTVTEKHGAFGKNKRVLTNWILWAAGILTIKRYQGSHRLLPTHFQKLSITLPHFQAYGAIMRLLLQCTVAKDRLKQRHHVRTDLKADNISPCNVLLACRSILFVTWLWHPV